MGYSGRPMLSVQNNKNLPSRKKRLFELPTLKLTEKKNGVKPIELGFYENEQIRKRRDKQLKQIKKVIFWKNIVILTMLLLFSTLIIFFIKS